VPYSAGDIVEAEARLQRLIDDAASTRGIQERANDRLVHLHRIAGRYADAKRRTRAQMAAAPDSRDDAFFAMDRVHEELFVYRRPDAARRELAAMRTAMSELEAGGGYLNAAVACGWVGDAACAREYIGRSSNRGALQPWSGPGIRFAAAGLARAEGDLTRALRILRDTRAVNCHACTEPYVARLFEEMNQPDSAAAAYERYIATPYMDRIFTDFALAPMHERLGEYYESRGDNRTASRHYGRFIALWQNADPELQGRVAVARQRLAELQPDR
jgi:tetratricopeptide (TPR) repeat protein